MRELAGHRDKGRQTLKLAKVLVSIAAGLSVSRLVLSTCLAAEQGGVTNLLPSVRIAKYQGDRPAALSYTFDDGTRDQYTLAVPMLNKVGFKGTFFVIPGAVVETKEQAVLKEGAKRAWGSILWPELHEMAAEGHEIASHTWSHRNLLKLAPDEVDAEFSKSYEAIKTHIGKPPLTVAFPFNATTPEIKAAALRYYVATRNYQASTSGSTTVASLNAWADKQVTDKTWGVMMTHTIANGYAALRDPAILETHLQYVKTRQTDIWVETFATIARYGLERDASKLSVAGKPGSLLCTLTCPLDPQTYDVPLTLVLDVPGATTAYAERSGQKLPAQVANGKLRIDATPSVQLISIEWK